MEDWQTIITFTYPQDAYMVRAYLESNEIQTIMTDELTAQVNNFYSTAVGGIKIKVKESDLNTANELLIDGGYIKKSDLKKRNIELLPKSEIIDKEFCPFCKSKNIAKKSEPNILTVIVFFILGVLFPIFRRSWVCFDCNKEWKYLNINK